jgi:omega-amidase
MAENNLRITLIQAKLSWENKDENLKMFSTLIDKVENTDIIILPEMFSTGFTMNAKANAETMQGNSVEWMRNIARKKNCILTGSLIIEEEGNYFNRLVWMTPDHHKTYDKRHLFSYAAEDKTYTAGQSKFIADLKGWKILPLVCYDLRFPVWSRRTAKENYDLLIYVANWPERRAHAWKQLLIARAIENQCYVAGVNRIGEDGNNIYHSGESVLIDFKGEKISNDSDGKEFVQTLELNMEDLVKFRNQYGFFADRDDFILK